MKEIILKTIEEHGQSARNKRCGCGWRPDYTDRRPDELFPEYRQHREHLATEIERELLPIMAAATLRHTNIAPCDPETYARGHNDGYEAAMSQELADDPTRADEWLEERLRQAQERAWAEGHEQGFWNGRLSQKIRKVGDPTPLTGADHERAQNPYRAPAGTPENTAQRSNQKSQSGPTTKPKPKLGENLENE